MTPLHQGQLGARGLVAAVGLGFCGLRLRLGGLHVVFPPQDFLASQNETRWYVGVLEDGLKRPGARGGAAGKSPWCESGTLWIRRCGAFRRSPSDSSLR